MAKLTIELDSETHAKLKELARKDERSLTQYIQRLLRQCAGTLIVTTSTPVVTPVTTPTSTFTEEEQYNDIKSDIKSNKKTRILNSNNTVKDTQDFDWGEDDDGDDLW